FVGTNEEPCPPPLEPQPATATAAATVHVSATDQPRCNVRREALLDDICCSWRRRDRNSLVAWSRAVFFAQSRVCPARAAGPAMPDLAVPNSCGSGPYVHVRAGALSYTAYLPLAGATVVLDACADRSFTTDETGYWHGEVTSG